MKLQRFIIYEALLCLVDIRFFRDAVVCQLEKFYQFRGRIFTYKVANPSSWGVVEFDKVTWKVKSIQEKLKNQKSNFAIRGLYL